MEKIGVGKIASVMGRYYVMDRDNNYDRVKLAYDAMTRGEGLTADCGICGIQASYDRGETDEFVKPTLAMEEGKPVATIQNKDSIIFFNSVPTGPGRSPELSVTTILRDSTEGRDWT